MWSKTSSYGFAHLINNESQHNDTFFSASLGKWDQNCRDRPAVAIPDIVVRHHNPDTDYPKQTHIQ